MKLKVDPKLKEKLDALAARAAECDAKLPPAKEERPRGARKKLRQMFESYFSPKPKTDWLLPMKYVADWQRRRRGQQALF